MIMVLVLLGHRRRLLFLGLLLLFTTTTDVVASAKGGWENVCNDRSASVSVSQQKQRLEMYLPENQQEQSMHVLDANKPDHMTKNISFLLLQLLRGGHCQVPCGIFDDPAMVAQIRQDATTIRKAMVESQSLHRKSSVQAMNQVVRWITTKEQHCQKIIDTVSNYGLCQRVKAELFATDEDYIQALKAHHAVLQCAMKAKQSMDVATCHALDHAIEDWSKMYLPVDDGKES